MAKKKKPLPPRRKRMKRHGRLQNAKRWLPTYSGKDPVRGYARWYGVDTLCAIAELRLLGVHVPEERKKQVLQTQEAKAAANRKRKELRKQEEIEPCQSDYDGLFEFVAGYTPAGFPYGIEREDAFSDPHPTFPKDEDQVPF